MMLHATMALLFGLILAAQSADAPKGPGKRPEGPPPGRGEGKAPPPPKEGGKPDAKCGKDLGSSLDELKKRKDVNREALEGITREHFKVFHPDGACHCECGHKAPPPAGEGEKRPDRKCGREAAGLGEELRKRKDPGNEDVDQHVKDHFRIRHPDGVCHCFCHHEEGPKEGGGKDSGKGPKGDAPRDNGKGNNGVGNGVDPQPPGKPPVNDGPGTGPGNPGNKKGGGK
jgi:hypothetical protein